MIKAWYTDAPTVALVLASIGNLYTALTGVFPLPKVEVTPLIALIMVVNVCYKDAKFKIYMDCPTHDPSKKLLKSSIKELEVEVRVDNSAIANLTFKLGQATEKVKVLEIEVESWKSANHENCAPIGHHAEHHEREKVLTSKLKVAQEALEKIESSKQWKYPNVATPLDLQEIAKEALERISGSEK